MLELACELLQALQGVGEVKVEERLLVLNEKLPQDCVRLQQRDKAQRSHNSASRPRLPIVVCYTTKTEVSARFVTPDQVPA
jgi:hypothetical protein